MLIVDAEESIRAMLKDPDSADFEHVDTYRTAKGAYVACGRVNAKNGFGGYNGYQRFVSPSTPSTTIVEGKVSDFAKAWAMCR
ncbi:MAG TPA: hypothetical protein VNW90_13430 [Acetobacteraceae bacterium]|jgi:hypothetical protein|nr:hypothetical protein [Acetobacteraceae bacterium]